MYPELTRLLNEMGMCNHMRLLQHDTEIQIEWGNIEVLDVDLPALESQAKKITALDEDDIYNFLDGEEEDQKDLTKKYNVKELHEFLSEAFDGKYTTFIYR